MADGMVDGPSSIPLAISHRPLAMVKFHPRQAFFLEFSHVRPLKMGVNQAQEGRSRR
jgi:hypothetical protein